MDVVAPFDVDLGRHSRPYEFGLPGSFVSDQNWNGHIAGFSEIVREQGGRMRPSRRASRYLSMRVCPSSGQFRDKCMRMVLLMQRGIARLLAAAGPLAVLLALTGLPGVTSARPPRVARKVDVIEKPLAGRKSALVEAIDLAKASLVEIEKARDYACTFTKKERIGNRLQESTMAVKCRHEPFSVYMKFAKPSSGRQVLFVKGANDDKLLVQEGGLAGFVGTFTLNLDDAKVMAENRYPITNFGMAALMKICIEHWEREAQYDEIQVRLCDVRLGETDCQLLEIVRPQFRQGMIYSQTRLWFARDSRLPIHIENYGFAPPGKPAPLLEEYTYSSIRINAGLKDADFDRRTYDL